MFQKTKPSGAAVETAFKPVLFQFFQAFQESAAVENDNQLEQLEAMTEAALENGGSLAGKVNVITFHKGIMKYVHV